MSDLFDLRCERPGIRLDRLEMYNWGTFDSSSGEVYVARPQGRTSLLVGRNGSGKSTLVDAMLTLLVPNAIRNYNVAAGAGKNERSERTYVYGACDQQLGDEDNHVSKRYLRKGVAFYSALLAYFYDEHAKSGFTIAQVLYPRADGSIDKIFLFAEGGRSIADDLSDLSRSDSLLATLKARGFRTTKTFNEYHGWFIRRTRVKPLAIDMFNQTVAVKDIRSLNAFIRNHMLEASSGRERVQKLVEHFAELRTAHRQLQQIQTQEKLLLPVEKHGRQYVQFQEQLQRSERMRESADAYFRLATLRLATPELERLKDQRATQVSQSDLLYRQIEEAGEDVRKLKNEIDLAGGERLREIPGLLKLQQAFLDQKQRARHDLATALSQCNRSDSVENAQQFAALGNSLTLRRSEIATQCADRQSARDQLVFERGDLVRRQRELTEELDALNKRRTSLPAALARVRAMLCEELRLEESELPFAAELVAVPEEHRQWVSSIEMVLRNFALSLLVPDRLYRTVSDYVEQNRLRDERDRGQRLVYLLVDSGGLGQTGQSHDRLHEDSLVRKLQFRAGHPLLPWVRVQIATRFDYRCCLTMEQFRETPRLAVTINRHTKTGNSKHEKDDRDHTADPSRFVLGWDNREKKRRLAQLIEELQAQIDGLTRRIANFEAEQRSLTEESNAIDRGLRVKSFDEIDDQTHRLAIAQLAEEKEALESSNDQIRLLRERLIEVEAGRKALNTQRDAVMQTIGTVESEIKSGEQLIANAQQALASMRADGRLERSQSAFSELEAALGEPLSFDNLFAREQHFREAQNKSIASLRRAIEPIEIQVTTAMGKFLTRCQEESQDLDSNIQSLQSFLAKLENIRREDLPRHEARFRERLNDTVTKEIGVFHSALRNEGRHIEGKIEELNQALRELPYNDGTFMRLDARAVKNPEINEFRNSLRACLDDAFEDTPEAREARFERIEKLISRLSEESTWRDRVIDVRRWYDFGACEIDRETGGSRSYYEDSSGQSGGEEARLAFTILVAAIAYQYDLDLTGRSSGGFHFVVVDEMFSKTDDRYAEYALKLFERFGLQLMIVAPLDAKARVTEGYVQYYLQVLKDEKNSRSQLVNMTAREYEEVLAGVSVEGAGINGKEYRREAEFKLR